MSSLAKVAALAGAVALGGCASNATKTPMVAGVAHEDPAGNVSVTLNEDEALRLVVPREFTDREGRTWRLWDGELEKTIGAIVHTGNLPNEVTHYQRRFGKRYVIVEGD